MTKEEFEERTGASVTSGEYTGIEQIYLNASDMEKTSSAATGRQRPAAER